LPAAILPPVKSPAAGAVRAGAMTAVVCLALAAVVAAMASLNVALPGIARATHATQTQLAWIIDAYSLVFASLLLPAGAIGDRYGRRLALIAGLAVFGAASAVAMTAASAGELIGLRAVMGLGAALVMPATLSTITGTFASQQRTRAVSVWAAVAGGAAVLGILVSGLVLQVWSWPSVFALNVILAAAAIAGAVRFVPESADPDTPRLDLGGAALAVAGLVPPAASRPCCEATAEPGTSASAVRGVAATCSSSTRTSRPATASTAAPTRNAIAYPSVCAIAAGIPVWIRSPAYRSARVTRVARPRAEPTCCMAVCTPEPRPESWPVT